MHDFQLILGPKIDLRSIASFLQHPRERLCPEEPTRNDPQFLLIFGGVFLPTMVVSLLNIHITFISAKMLILCGDLLKMLL